MTGWLILVFICIGVALICFGIDLLIERRRAKANGYKFYYEPNNWFCMTVAICAILFLIFGLVALVVPIDSAHRIADLQAILEVDPTNDVAISDLVKYAQDVERFGMFADKWTVREKIAELLTIYGG